jgi:hypothetical protein
MIQHPRKFLIGLGLILLSIIFSFPYPYSRTLGEEVGLRLGIPIYSNMELELGLHYVGVLTTILFIVGLYIVAYATKQGRKRYVIPLVFLLVIYTPSTVISLYQYTFASGVYALEQRSTTCDYEQNNRGVMVINCDVLLENYSNHYLEGELLFIEEKYWTDPFSVFSLLNHASPHPFSIAPRSNHWVNVFLEVDVSGIDEAHDAGSASLFSVIVKIGEKKRILTPKS